MAIELSMYNFDQENINQMNTNSFKLDETDTTSNYSTESIESAESADSFENAFLCDNYLDETYSNIKNKFEYMNMIDNEKFMYHKIIQSSIFHVMNKQWTSIKNKRIMHDRRTKIVEQTFNGGVTSELTKETPFIKFLIKKRLATSDNGPSNHIAAILPDIGIKHCCYLRGFGKASYW